jgi:transmembrane sensor
MENRYHELAKKWMDNTITPAEQAEFAAWYNTGQDNPVEIPPEFAGNDEDLKQRIFNKINREIKKNGSPIKKMIPMWLRYAAAIFLFAGCFICYNANTHHPVRQRVLAKRQKAVKNDAGPGGNKAVLTLANGSKINLSDVKNGVLASQGQTVLKKDKDGRIIYEAPGGNAVDSSAIFNTITIPRGGQFQVVLSDGSKVWLNSSSSITFPAVFSKSERKVTITGEVYFEVAKNKAKPFRVIAREQTVEVLGTHFNINAYSDEDALKTTLVEGSVKVTAGAQSVVLKPEQQASIAAGQAGRIRVTAVDTENVLAWTTGNFQFEKAEIPLIMREAARWYDVDIKYEGEMPKRRFTGSISRSVNLSELLKMLKYTGINFKIAGKTIVVTS